MFFNQSIHHLISRSLLIMRSQAYVVQQRIDTLKYI